MTRSELADAMLKGLHTPTVREEPHAAYISQGLKFCYACALGCALIGKLNGDVVKAERVYRHRDQAEITDTTETTAYDIFGDLLNIDPELAIEIEHKHLNGMPIQQIAAWLKSSEGGEDVQ